MKKISFLALAATSLMLASCSSDEDLKSSVPDGTPVDVTFTADIADLGTRADYGDGLTARHLDYAVYDDKDNLLFTDEATFEGSAYQTNVTIQLVTGETYKIVFWAQDAANKAYVFNAAAKKMTINYANVANNNESLDAFYTVETLTVDANHLDQTATLTRPFAQLNIATGDRKLIEGEKNDEGEYTVQPLGTYPETSSVILENVPNVLNLLDGSVEGENPVTFQTADLPEDTINVGGKDYDYLSMTYVLAPKAGAVINSVTMNVNTCSDNFVYTSIPVKRNYKTNIVGDLLTAKTNWTVNIDAGWNTPSLDNYVVVSTAAEFNAAIAAGEDVFLSQDITVPTFAPVANETTNIDLGGNTMTITPGYVSASSISGTTTLRISNGSLTHLNPANGFIANTGNTFNILGSADLILENVTLKTDAMYAIGTWDSGNITLNGCNISALLGIIATNATNPDPDIVFTIKDCVLSSQLPILVNNKAAALIEGCTINGTSNGIVCRGGHNVTIKNTTVNIDYKGTYYTVGYVSGYKVPVVSSYTAAQVAALFRTDWSLSSEDSWGTGWYVPAGGLVLGNRSTSYQWSTNVTADNLVINVAQSEIPSVYGYANQADGYGINFDYTGGNLVSGAGVVWDSANILVNGVQPE